MFNRGVPAFYNPKLDIQTKEERFLLKRRMRLLEKIQHINAVSKGRPFYEHELRKLNRKLKETEAKLGIKP